MWLNEGFTSYVESRITEAVYGAELRDMESVIGQHGVLEDMKEIPEKWQLLAQEPLVGVDPDEASSQVAYIKGEWFLDFLEERYGRAIFDPFLRKWFDTHAFTSQDSAEFERFLMAELVDKNPGKTTHEEIHEWLHAPGIPKFAKPATSARFDAVDEARTHWLAGHMKPSDIDTGAWMTQEWVRFIEGLPQTLKPEQLAELDAAWHFTGTANVEIAQRWYPLTVRSGYLAARPAIEKFLIHIGRRKLIMPTYGALVATPEGKAFAQQVYAKAKAGYHPITIVSVEQAIASGGAKPL
jgi:hypothetical protein